MQGWGTEDKAGPFFGMQRIAASVILRTNALILDTVLFRTTHTFNGTCIGVKT